MADIKISAEQIILRIKNGDCPICKNPLMEKDGLFICTGEACGFSSPRRKIIGYLAPQYYDGEPEKTPPEELKGIFDEMREKAKSVQPPDYPVKYAGLYYTYRKDDDPDEKYYFAGPGSLVCDPDVFERISDELMNRLYLAGAYDMFYSGMLD